MSRLETMARFQEPDDYEEECTFERDKENANDFLMEAECFLSALLDHDKRLYDRVGKIILNNPHNKQTLKEVVEILPEFLNSDFEKLWELSDKTIGTDFEEGAFDRFYSALADKEEIETI